jgi:hypothetical protein
MTFAAARLHLANAVAQNIGSAATRLTIQRGLDKDEIAANRRADFVLPPKNPPAKKLVFFAHQGGATA